MNEERARAYEKHLKSYPELLTVKQLCEALCGISTKHAYFLLKSNEIRHLRIGGKIIIPKQRVIEYLATKEEMNNYFLDKGV